MPTLPPDSNSARDANLPTYKEKFSTTLLTRLRGGPSVFGSPASDDAIKAIRVSWVGETIKRATQRVNASMGDLKATRPAEGTFARRRMQAASINAVKEGRFESLVQSLLASRYDPSTFQSLKLEAGISQRLNILRDVLDKADVTVSEGCDYSLTDPDDGDDACTCSCPPDCADCAEECTGCDTCTCECTDDEEEEDASEDALSNMMTALDFTGVLKHLSRECWMHKAMCAMPRVTWSDRLGKRKAEICTYDPSRFDLVSMEEDGDWDILVIYNPAATERTLYTSRGWAEQSLNARSGEWETGEFGDNPGGGGIDAVIFKPVKGKLWWEEAYGSQLAEATIQANAAETFIDWLMSTQVKMPAGELDNTAKGQILAQGKGLNVGVNGNATMLDFQLNLSALVDLFITRERDNAAKAIGLSGSEWSSAVAPATSGVAERIKFWARDRIAIARRSWFIPLATELYWVAQRVIAAELPVPMTVMLENVVDGEIVGETVSMVLPIDGFDGGWVDDGNPNGPPAFTPPNPQDVLPPFTPGVSFHAQPINLVIDAREVGYPSAPLEKIAQDDSDLSHAFTTEAELMLERNPDLGTLKAARARLVANKMENATMSKVGKPEPVVPVPTSLKMAVDDPTTNPDTGTEVPPAKSPAPPPAVPPQDMPPNPKA